MYKQIKIIIIYSKKIIINKKQPTRVSKFNLLKIKWKKKKILSKILIIYLWFLIIIYDMLLWFFLIFFTHVLSL